MRTLPLLVLGAAVAAQDHAPLRAPAIPLVTNDPYVSAWLRGDELNAAFPTHWSGSTQALTGMLRVDGVPFRFLGREPGDVATLPQTRVEVGAFTTQVWFTKDDVTLRLRFTSPVLPEDPEVASRAVTYVTIDVTAKQPHDFALYLDASAEWAVHSADQKVRWSRLRAAGHELLGFATQDQRVLERVGDHTRLDWGTFWLGAPASSAAKGVLGAHDEVRRAFARSGELPADDDLAQPRAANDRWPIAAFAIHGQGERLTLPLVLAYDEGTCLEYLGQKLRPYWQRTGQPFARMLATATRERAALEERCDAAGARLRSELEKVGGPRYAELATLACRQVMAAQALTCDARGRLLGFTKENTSNGCIGTVDVLFPTAPFFLATNPELLAAHLRPILEYASSPRWRFPFAPHDLGTWPQANGQVYGGGEVGEDNQMPVEESGNLLILVAAHAQASGNLDLAKEHKPALARWAQYLTENGLDPAHQLCTDDFAGHLARNANLAIKAIVAIGAWSELCTRLGDEAAAKSARATAEDFAKRWLDLARGEHGTVLVYGRPETWSLKYNLFWDRALGTRLFPAALAASELAFYETKCNRYGTPMDSRADYTKPEWIVWCASLAATQQQFRKLVDPLWAFANETRDRVPLSDWFMTSTAKHCGMHARSVVGGIYAPWYLAQRGAWLAGK